MPGRSSSGAAALQRDGTLERVRDYYGRVLKTKADLKTTACCAADSLPPHLAAIAREVHPEVSERFYGCGSVIPPELEGRTVLDLGCGSGRDCYILSKLVGPSGRVIGLDMTDEQLSVARRHRDHHAGRFGHPRSNVEFLQGYIEDVSAAGVAPGSVDVVVSNCVINLSPAKREVFAGVFKALKPGGELFFSDVFCDRRLPAEAAQHPAALGECLGGAMYWEDFRRLMLELGCRDHRVVSRAPIGVKDPALLKVLGPARFSSVTVRAFKLELEDRCEDYGQSAVYRGTLPECPHALRLDDHHLFERGRPVAVCSNTARMLAQTRYARHFEVRGDLSTHFGLFPCGASAADPGPERGASCC